MVICQNWLWKTEATSGHQASPLHFARCRSSISTDHRDGCHLATMESPWRNSPGIFRSKIDGICWIHGIFGISMDVANYPKPNCCVIFFGFWSISKRTIYLPTNTGDSCAFLRFKSNKTLRCFVHKYLMGNHQQRSGFGNQLSKMEEQTSPCKSKRKDFGAIPFGVKHDWLGNPQN